MKRIYTKKLFILLGLCLGLWSCEDDSDFSGKDNYILSFRLSQKNITYDGSIEGEYINLTVPANISIDDATSNIKLSENASISPDPTLIKEWTDGLTFTVTSYNGQGRTYTLKIKKAEMVFDGDVVLSTQKEVDEFTKSPITKISGSLTLGQTTEVEKADSINNIDGLKQLLEVEQTLTINSTFALDNFNDLSNLQRIGSLVSTNTNVKEIILPNLKRVDNSLKVYAYKAEKISFTVLSKVGQNIEFSIRDVVDLNISSLESCGGSLEINHGKMTEILLPSLKKVNGKLTITATEVTKLDLGELSSIGGALQLYGSKMADINFSSLESTAGDFKLESLVATKLSFPKLKDISGQFMLNSLESMTEFSAPELLSTGQIYFYKLPVLEKLDLKKLAKTSMLEMTAINLTNLNGFESLTVATYVYIQNCSKLVSYSGLKNIVPSLNNSKWTTRGNAYNPTYQNMVDGLYDQQ